MEPSATEQTIQKPQIRKHLLWDFDFETFDFEASGNLVIERVLERGNPKDWREMLRFYPRERIVKTIETSRQLPEKDKRFALLFIDSTYHAFQD